MKPLKGVTCYLILLLRCSGYCKGQYVKRFYFLTFSSHSIQERLVFFSIVCRTSLKREPFSVNMEHFALALMLNKVMRYNLHSGEQTNDSWH